MQKISGVVSVSLGSRRLARGLSDVHTARAVPGRGVKAVYDHLRRACSPMAKRGKWSPLEDNMLHRVIEEAPGDWAYIAESVERLPVDCQDRFTKHIQVKSNRHRGTWKPDEEERLLHIMRELSVALSSARTSGLIISSPNFPARTRRGYGLKWTITFLSSSKRLQCLRQCLLIFHNRVAFLTVDRESDIDWKSLRDDAWSHWSPHVLGRKWKALRNEVDTGGMNHQGVYLICVEWHSPSWA
ncbi:hypothetical protein BC834DRAFT_837999 [Gloeopeniophorella convolvens]|nr:hypothetical protein BC834DRAFT_837999 [Gloeopeniophorella convolvens]